MWVMAYRFDGKETAGIGYNQARDVVFGTNIDASVYRVQIKGVWHVVVLGDGQLAEQQRLTFEQACAQGATAELPVEVRTFLEERRASGKLPGAFWEANYQPGQVIPNRRIRRRAS